MKKIILSLFLLLAFTDAETPIKKDSEIGKWRSFVGVEGGVGVFASFSTFLGGINPVAVNDYPLGLGYSLGISGGWQKYTHEKVGIRHTLGLGFSYVPNVTSIRNKTLDEWCFLNCKNVKKINLSDTNGYNIVGYYALDGLFDFVKNGENRFGMSLGFGIDVMSLSFFSTGGKGMTYLFGSLRTGFYTRIGNNLFDINLKLPALGMAFNLPMFDTTVTLGYKYLF